MVRSLNEKNGRKWQTYTGIILDLLVKSWIMWNLEQFTTIPIFRKIDRLNCKFLHTWLTEACGNIYSQLAISVFAIKLANTAMLLNICRNYQQKLNLIKNYIVFCHSSYCYFLCG